MPVISVVTKERNEMVDITREVERLVPKGFGEGICVVSSRHTTAGITINENADPDVKRDILSALDAMATLKEKSFRHAEGNSAAHVKTLLTGTSQTTTVKNGRLGLGTWQGIYFCEFDGPRERFVEVSFIKE